MLVHACVLGTAVHPKAVNLTSRQLQSHSMLGWARDGLHEPGARHADLEVLPPRGWAMMVTPPCKGSVMGGGTGCREVADPTPGGFRGIQAGIAAPGSDGEVDRVAGVAIPVVGEVGREGDGAHGRRVPFHLGLPGRHALLAAQGLLLPPSDWEVGNAGVARGSCLRKMSCMPQQLRHMQPRSPSELV